MDATQLILPAFATLALGTALLVPLRDDRRGRRATLGGDDAPFRPRFGLRSIDVDAHAALDGTEASHDPRTPTEAPSKEAKESPSPSEPLASAHATKAEADAPFSWLVRVGTRVLGLGAVRSTPHVERPTSEATEAEVVDRSFASELASLLDAATVRTRESALARDEPATARPPDAATIPFETPAPPVTDATTLVRSSPPQSPPFDPVDVLPLPIPARTTASIERVVPITRLPLRPHGLAITWIRDVSFADSSVTGAEPSGRRALLERLLHDSRGVAYATIERAYHEEEPPRRLLALRVLVSHHAKEARAVFVDALHTGTDDERALAVEGLAVGDALDALPAAFSDRVEAIAARAAFEFVGFADRSAYRTALAPFVDTARLDALLLLLAGVVE